MKINITNIYGMSGQSTALIAQNETVKIAKKLDFHELSFYFYNIYSDSQGELNSRLDGVLAKLGYGDIVLLHGMVGSMTRPLSGNVRF